MKNSFNENYTFWLTRYQSEHKDRISGQLIDKIAELSDIKELIALFSQYLEPEYIPYKEIGLCTKLSSWKIELENIVENHGLALIQLKEIQITQSNRSLVLFLREILSEKQLLLHIQMPSLLKALCSDLLPQLITYIVELPIALPPSCLRPGSFAAEIAKSPEHAACLALLNNTSAAVEEKHLLWNNANILLQTSLVIYKEISLEDEVPIDKKHEKKCTLM